MHTCIGYFKNLIMTCFPVCISAVLTDYERVNVQGEQFVSAGFADSQEFRCESLLSFRFLYCAYLNRC